MAKRFAAAAVGLTLALGVTGAQAQISPNGGPLDISADAVTFDNAARVAVYKGKVEALQGPNRMRADVLNIYFASGSAPSGSSAPGIGDIDHLDAIGNVYFVTPQQVARGDKAVYSPANDTIVLTGNVVVSQGENVLRGDRLTINVKTTQSQMDGTGGRVRSVFYPTKK